MLRAAVFAAALAAAPAWAAEATTDEDKSPVELLDEATQNVMRALELMFRSIPQYELPEINENGDIIIRRIHPEDEAEEPEAAPPVEPGTAET